MNINAQIIDQHINGLRERLADQLTEIEGVGANEDKQRSALFVLLSVKYMLVVDDDEALDCLTEGSQDFGVDAFHISPVADGEFTVTLFQGKYSRKLDGESRFPEDSVRKLITAVGNLFDPSKDLTINRRLAGRVEEARSLIRDGYIPQVHVVACNNGKQWAKEAQELIDQAGFGGQVSWDFVNHDILVSLLQASKPISASLRLAGKSIVEDFDFRRVLIGRVPVTEFAALFDEHGDQLLERNIRRYLGLQGNRVNDAIRATLDDANQRSNFYFYNNGITITCTQLRYNALQEKDWQLKLEGMQVINGGQTCKTIQRVLSEGNLEAENAHVLVRIYELPEEDHDLVMQITYATNSQNPVDLRDLRSNDERQRRLAHSINQLGYSYRRQRSQEPVTAMDITSATAAEAVLAVWRKKPHQAKFRSAKHFDEPLYSEIFDESLNGAQVIVATLLFRFAENRRKRPPEDAPDFLPYSSHFIAMLTGSYLLQDMNCHHTKLTHQNIDKAKKMIEENARTYFERAMNAVQEALDQMDPGREKTLQWYSAQFRRSDLIDTLEA